MMLGETKRFLIIIIIIIKGERASRKGLRSRRGEVLRKERID
jgi:hypothetical protein